MCYKFLHTVFILRWQNKQKMNEMKGNHRTAKIITMTSYNGDDVDNRTWRSATLSTGTLLRV